jgi:hypothetical protein
VNGYVADMDFKTEAAKDCVTDFRTIGRGRDLEERWQFFLSEV